MTGVRLRALSISMRVLFTSFMVTAGVGFLMAIYLLFLQDIDPHRKMGLSVVPSVIVKYYGDRGNTRLESALRGSMSNRLGAEERDAVFAWLHGGATQEEFAAIKPILDKNCISCHSAGSGISVPPLTTFDEVKKVARVDTGASLIQLARVSHVHLFGISIVFLLTGMIFALSSISSKWRLSIITLPYLAMWADIGSWWLTKYEPVFAYVVVASGALIGLALAVQIFVSLWEMWLAGLGSNNSRLAGGNHGAG